jgi:hypothetical protein
MTVYKALKFIGVIEEVSNEGKSPKLGHGYFKAHRLNPCNPLTYVWLLFSVVVVLVLFGVMGLKDLTEENPFKWS